MPSPSLVLWADSTRNNLAAGWQSNLDASSITLRQGDNLGVELHWVRRTTNFSSIMDEVAWPVSANITLAVGRIDQEPSSGTFTLYYGGEETDGLPYNATALQVETALNNLTGIGTDGGVTVTKTATSYRILWNNVGVASSTITVGSNDLTPTSSIGIATARTGTVSVRQLVQIHIKQAPVAVCTSWVTQDAPAITITQVHAPAYSGDYRVWRMVISPEPKSGTYRLSKTINSVTTWSAPLSYASDASAIAGALGAGVTVVGPLEYEITQAQVTGEATVNITAIGSDASGLIAYESKYGVLNLNTLDLELLLGGASSATAYLEVEVEVSGTRETLVQKQVTIVNDLIDADSYTLTTWGEVIPADSVVRYDTSQGLTTPQKAQARTNIGALGSSDLSAYTTKDAELETRLGLVETTLTTNVQNALSGSSSPSSSNVFVTASALAGKADAVHTHAISDVTNLTTTLAGKASTTHTHIIADITSLQTELNSLNSGKANTSHTHSQSDITGLTSALSTMSSNIASLATNEPTSDQKAAMTYSTDPSSTNAFVTVSYLQNTDRVTQSNASGYTNGGFQTHYPYEVLIYVNGVQYAIPARLV